ncbi:NAD(P)H-dependent oxidoreductase [Pseudoalteromonas sp. MMG005]|uniref:NAD(P)H-dependent oxidoreductase n=1 Tax=Pseudoalteromonas sp. MMG005 TaxID=2822682 RepID=UPI001B39F148|nr:NAD(P)H-dependent oxidoreductase [Pseudoalteromonas sp. MMG005]MBQ4848281.1 NAD(P)H-dependent oxidoreductase [Pseudoalteromonas sp. MMG005]
MKKILINFAHPAKSRSNINIALRNAVENIEHVTVNDLYANYPDFMIDIKREQALCEAHDIIIFQHPFYWYSTPAIMKEWLDLVLEHGWAYGTEGKALAGKVFFQAITTGGDASNYQKDGYNEFTLKELTAPYRATAKLCRLIWLPPFVVTGVHQGLEPEEIQSYSAEYKRTLIALRDSLLDLEVLTQQEVLNNNHSVSRSE